MNFFLVDVWKQSKVVFAFFVVFIAGTMWCTFSKIEITPFFLWAHYSEQQASSGRYERIYIQVNGELLDLPKLTRPTREMIQLPTEYFVKLERTDYETGTRQLIRAKMSHYFSDATCALMEKRLCNSTDDKEAYLKWLARYVERIYGKRVESLEIGTVDLVFESNGKVVRENRTVVANYLPT